MIGLFDSGSGGLSVLSALRALAPKANIIYFGDIANAPYGERTLEELTSLAQRGVQLLWQYGAVEIVSACNSVSASVLDGAVEGDRVIEMTRPSARMMLGHRGKRILLIATPATIASNIYQQVLDPIVSLDVLPIAALAGAIEFGATEGDVISIVRNALQTKSGPYDCIFLGCTHYPLVRPIIEHLAQEKYGNIVLLDPAHAVAEEVVRSFDVNGDGIMRFIISKESSIFRERVTSLFGDMSHTIELT